MISPLFLTIIARMYTQKMNVMAFAQIIGRLFMMIPYISHNSMPIENITYIGTDRSCVRFVLYILYACGKNANVVHAAASIPMRVMRSMFYPYPLQRYSAAVRTIPIRYMASIPEKKYGYTISAIPTTIVRHNVFLLP